MKLDKFDYEKFDYDVYQKRINEMLKNEDLLSLGLRKNTLGTTKYGYDLDEFVIGHGKKDLFIVGGTHGSEIIGVDFVTQLMKYVPNMTEFNPNEVTIHFMPLQNPEGFDITSQTLKEINDDNLTNESKDYYLRYRTDNVLNSYINDLNKLINSYNGVITPKVYIKKLKETLKIEKKEEDGKLIEVKTPWTNLKNALPNLTPGLMEFKKVIDSIEDYNDFFSLKSSILLRCSNIKSDDPIFKIVKDRLLKSLFSDEIMYNIAKKNKIELDKSLGERLYQDRFKDIEISGTKNEKLSQDVAKAFEINGVPKGSQVKFDPNGNFVNLNKNVITNPGIERIQKNIITYGATPSNNIIDNSVGPIGKPTIDVYNFEEEFENKVLRELIDKSYKEGRLLSVILYHGTGGMIYHLPDINENNESYQEYNNQLADIYQEKTEYRKINENDDPPSFDGLLRQLYPGVLLVELSKMGGNPIAPYGDTNNYYKVLEDNINAIDNILKNSHSLKL